MRQFTLITLILFLVAESICNGQNKHDTVSLLIDFNAGSTIELNYKNAVDSMMFQTSFYNFFPNDYITSVPIKFQGSGTKYLNLKTQMPQKVNLSIGFVSSKSATFPSDTLLFNINQSTACFLVPYDTLRISVDFSKKKQIPECIKYSGRWAQLSDYYKNKELFFHRSDFIGQKGLTASTAPDFISFNKVLDSLTRLELIYLSDYYHRNLLPKWFLEYEESDIRYFSYSLKISEPMLMRRMRGIDKPVPKDYYNFLNDRPLNNMTAILSIYYYLFLDYYFSMYESPLEDSRKPDSNYTTKRNEAFISHSKKDFTEYISDILLARSIDLEMGNGYITKKEYDLYCNEIHSADLKQYLERRYNKQYVLKEGDTAPYFYLKNERNKSVSLNQFEGNIVYLSFWFTGCKPCIKEIPDENHLVDVFKNEKVKIISICMQSPEESWRQIIEKYGVKSITLFAMGNWNKLLKEKYDIESFPHHVLIDKHGKIILNKCQRPEAGAEQVIRKWLDKP